MGCDSSSNNSIHIPNYNNNMTKEDKALLDCKLCRDKINQYIKLCDKNAAKKREAAKDALRGRNKEKAKQCLRYAKMYNEQSISANEKLTMIEDQIAAIQQSQNMKGIMSVLQNGNETLKQLQKEVNVEKFQDIADDMEDIRNQQEEVYDFFRSKGLDANEKEMEVDGELAALSAQLGVDSGLNFPAANMEVLPEFTGDHVINGPAIYV